MSTLRGGYETARASRDAQIVVSGMAGMFPNSRNVDEYLTNLFNKVHLCDEDDRRGKMNHPEVPKLTGKVYDVDQFDCGMFGYHKYQALHLDPLGRILLEQVAAALFDAGIHPDDLKGTKTGVFMAGCCSEYELLLYLKAEKDDIKGLDLFSSNTKSMHAQRVSYWLQLEGPSFNCDTACSSGMYAMEEAYRAIIEGRCDRAIVAGTNLCLDFFMTLQFARLGVLNYGCGCRPFDQDACGYTRAEAIVAVIFQKEPEAKRVYANLIHAKTNADGYKSQGITFPSSEGQYTVLQEVYNEANIRPDEIGFVEAHGTGTVVGDPEELTVIGKFFNPTVEKPLLIGSVKGNIGHTEPSSGLCSLVKLMGAFNTGLIPPNIHFDKPREDVEVLVSKRLQVVTEVTPYPADKIYGGLNNFGFGGGNGHIIFKRFAKQKELLPAVSLESPRLVCYSGRTHEALAKIHECITNNKDVEFISLMQESFKKPSVNHLHRGFTLVGSDLQSFKPVRQVAIHKLILVMDNFQKVQFLPDFMKIPLFKTNFEKIETVFKSVKGFKLDANVLNQTVSLVLLQTLIDLEMELHLLENMPNLVQLYLKNKITFEDLVYDYIVNNNNSNVQDRRSVVLIDNWIKENTKYGSKATIVAIGSNKQLLTINSIRKCHLIHFGNDMKMEDMLCNIGRLYEEGYNPQVHKLYPPIQYPVSNGTQTLSHLLKLKHDTYELLRFASKSHNDSERRDIIVMGHLEYSFYRGHLIDNRNLFPATGYLYLIWNFFCDLHDVHPNYVSILFENIRFHRACTIGHSGIELYLVIHADGNFEVSENEQPVVFGRISYYNEEIEGREGFVKHEDCKLSDSDDEDSFILNSKDVYKELRLRGYNYSGLFRAVHEVGPVGARIKWDNNWVTFLDNMMQVCILQEDTRSLYVPVGLERLVIRGKEHIDYVESLEEKLIPVSFDKVANTIQSKFIQMRGLMARPISRRKTRLQPVLETYQFIPNEYETDLATSVRINMQIILECKPSLSFKVVEVVKDGDEEQIVLENICNIIEDMPVVLPDLTVVTTKENFEMENVKIETAMTEQNILFICHNPDDVKLEQADKATLPDGFLLFVCSSERTFAETLTVLTKHIIEDQKIVYFLRKSLTQESTPTIIDISNNQDVKWLKEVQNAMQTSKDVVVFAQSNYKSGILGMTNCLTKEPGGDKARCIFIQDPDTIWDPKNLSDDVKTQLAKKMVINVFKNGQWGTYRHLLLSNLKKVEANHWFAKTKTAGDMGSLCLHQGAITKDKLKDKNVYKIEYSALNFRDLMLASGKLSSDAITRDRLMLDMLQGFEFVGYDHNGKRVCGMGTGAIANVIENPYYVVEIPDNWSFEDMSTIFVVYCTVLTAMFQDSNLQRGQTVLIHSGTGGIGLAALNVCTYFDCNIFVTVGTQEKRDYLIENYPKLKANQIGNSRDTSFLEMVMKETNGRGVDIVLNSLAEEKLQASVECLAESGAFLEIGKYDLDKNSDLSMDLSRRGCSYRGVMLDNMFQTGAEAKINMLETMLLHGMEAGYVKPLPRTVFKIDELHNAFKFMGTGKHMGKVLIQIEHDKVQQTEPRLYCKPECSYIVFGGLGGFGLELTDWLILRGAKTVIISSRTGLTTGYQRYRLRIWKSYGVKVIIAKDDVTDYETCLKFIENVNSKAPLDGIFNLAVVLKDAIFEHQNIESIQISMAPKATLTEHLDKITRIVCPKISYFVVFSSVSCGRGNGGQTNYGFSNSVMERICELRYGDGLPAIAVQWGAVGDVGLLEALQREQSEIAIGGTLQQKVGNCLQVLDQLLKQDMPIVSSIVVAEKFNRGVANSPMEAVITILGVKDIKSISPHSTFPELGMDSMMAVEIKQTLERDFDILLGPKDLRSLTFAKLEEMSQQGAGKLAKAAYDTEMLSMLISSDIMLLTQETIIDFNQEVSTNEEDFILMLPGLGSDFRCYEKMAININKHLKCIRYDGITRDQENVDLIVDYLYENVYKHLRDGHKQFRIIAHSMGSIAAIELARVLELNGFTGTLVFIDGSPDFCYAMYELIKGNSVDEMECNIIELCVSFVLASESTVGLKDLLLKCTDSKARVEFVVTHYSTQSEEIQEQLKTLTSSLLTRIKSIAMYKEREITDKIKSNVVLYKSNIKIVEDAAEDYGLNTRCENLRRMESFDGTHLTVLTNDNLYQQLVTDLYT